MNGLIETDTGAVEGIKVNLMRLIIDFFKARGNPAERHRLVRLMRELRQQLSISFEQFMGWFKNLLIVFSAAEHEAACRRVLPIYWETQQPATFVSSSSLFVN